MLACFFCRSFKIHTTYILLFGPYQVAVRDGVPAPGRIQGISNSQNITARKMTDSSMVKDAHSPHSPDILQPVIVLLPSRSGHRRTSLARALAAPQNPSCQPPPPKKIFLRARIRRLLGWCLPPILMPGNFRRALSLLLPPALALPLPTLSLMAKELLSPPRLLAWLVGWRELLQLHTWRRACRKHEGEQKWGAIVPVAPDSILAASLLALWIAGRKKGEGWFYFDGSAHGIVAGSIRHKIANRLFEKAFLKGRVHFATVSSAQARAYAEHLAVPMHILPLSPPAPCTPPAPLRAPDLLTSLPATLKAELYSGAAGALRLSTRETRIAAALLELVTTSGKTGNQGNRPPQAGVIYPWPDLLTKGSGASVRCELLIRYLHEIGCPAEALTLQPQDGPAARQGLQRECLPPPAGPLKFLFAHLEERNRARPIADYHTYWQLLTFYHQRHRSVRLALNRMLIGKTAVFAEYPFYMETLAPFARELNVPVCCTFYDRISSCKTKFLKSFLLRKELAAMRAATMVATVSRDEHAFYEARGIKNFLIPSHGDLPAAVSDPERKWLDSLVPADWKVVFMFIGSGYAPNIEAKEVLKTLAVGFERENLPWGILVLGDCASPADNSSRLIALGHVDAAQREACYERADLFLSPLAWGTGSSVKTMESMARGVAVLGTSYAFRGYEIENGITGFVEDNPANYAARIRQILDDPDLLEGVRRRGKDYAEQTGYRITFAPYKALVCGQGLSSKNGCGANAP